MMNHTPIQLMRRDVRTKKGFTLIELLVTIAIILILAGITFGITKGVYNAQARATAKAEIATIAQALEAFKLQYGDYPRIDANTGDYTGAGAGFETSTMMLYALTGRMEMGRDTNGEVTVDLVGKNLNDDNVEKKPSFLDSTKFTYSGTDNNPNALLDPWGVPYVYKFRTETNPDNWEGFGYVLYSMGGDGVDREVGNNGILTSQIRQSANNRDNVTQENKMKKKHHKNNAFTLIELLMVIAIIGILAGILIPTVGSVRKQANIAASKAQLSNYVTAIQMFKGEYGFYPFSDAQTNNGAQINGLSDDFVETLSGRNGRALVTTGGNRRSIGFHSFSESEFFTNDDDSIDENIIADRFNNDNLFIAIDGDGDGEVTVPTASGGTRDLKAAVTAYAGQGDNGAPDYYLYE